MSDLDFYEKYKQEDKSKINSNKIKIQIDCN